MSDCIFCRIAQKKLPAAIVHEDDNVIAFNDVHPQAPVHILVIPRKHIPRLMDVPASDMPLIVDIHRVIQELARKQGVQDTGFRLAVNNGPFAGQAVDHLHYHLLAGRKLGWPPG